MKVMNIIHDSIVDGEGLRTAVFFAGCPHRCFGCHNPSSWNIQNGTEMSEEEILESVLSNPLSNVTLSGGEPFEQANQVSKLAAKLKASKKSIWCYTGYTYEQLLTKVEWLELLVQIDVLVDGRFELEKRDLGLIFKGSSNQRIIDVQKSLENDCIILYQ